MAFGSHFENVGSSPPEAAPDAPDVLHIPHFMAIEDSRLLMQSLLAELDFRPDELVIAGRPVSTKRLHDFRSDPGKSYSYSGGAHEDRAWTPGLLSAKALVESALGLEFNSCLCNLYPSGKVGMGWHADKEGELGREPNIASLSMGATRLFRFRRRGAWREKTGYQKWDFLLGEGDLLLMRGQTQQYFEHELAPSLKVKDPRLNLTFRTVLGARNLNDDLDR